MPEPAAAPTTVDTATAPATTARTGPPTVPPPSRMRCYSVPTDGQWHEFTLSGPVNHVAGINPHVVQFWSVSQPNGISRTRAFIAVEDDDDIPPYSRYVDSVVYYHMDPRVVWHLFERVQ